MQKFDVLLGHPTLLIFVQCVTFFVILGFISTLHCVRLLWARCLRSCHDYPKRTRRWKRVIMPRFHRAVWHDLVWLGAEQLGNTKPGSRFHRRQYHYMVGRDLSLTAIEWRSHAFSGRAHEIETSLKCGRGVRSEVRQGSANFSTCIASLTFSR